MADGVTTELVQGIQEVVTVPDSTGVGSANTGNVGSDSAIRSASLNGEQLVVQGAPEHYTVSARTERNSVRWMDANISTSTPVDDVYMELTVNNPSMTRDLSSMALYTVGSAQNKWYGRGADTANQRVVGFINPSFNGTGISATNTEIMVKPINTDGTGFPSGHSVNDGTGNRVIPYPSIIPAGGSGVYKNQILKVAGGLGGGADSNGTTTATITYDGGGIYVIASTTN